MKRIFIFLSLMFFSAMAFSEIVSFDDIRAHYQVFMNAPTLDNLRTLSEELDIFRESDFYNTMQTKYPAYKETFENLDAEVKSAMGTFDNPWLSGTGERLDMFELNRISNAFFDFVLQQNIYIAKTSSFYRTLFITLSIFLVLGFSLTLAIIRMVKNKKEALLQSKYILQGQETERKRISEDLHDTIAQNLKAQKLQILNARDNLPKSKSLENEWNDIYASVTENLKDIRDICQNLFPPNFANQKIEWILVELCLNTEKKFGIKCTHSISDDCIVRTYNEECKLHVFRILQEAVNNAVWHGKCSSIKITMQKKEIRISDDGIGFSVSETMATKSNHFGLRSIIERAKILGGRAVITSGANGTEIVVILQKSPPPPLLTI